MHGLGLPELRAVKGKKNEEMGHESTPMTADELTAFQFFREFSRFEYALKHSGFLKGSEGNNANPDWDKYAKHIGGRFENTEDQCLKDAIKYMTDKPPNKQIVQGGKPDWHDMRWDDDNSRQVEENVLCAVRVVRNNLFHGEKRHMLLGGSDGNTARDKKLLEAGIAVLRYCKSDSKRREEFGAGL